MGSYLALNLPTGFPDVPPKSFSRDSINDGEVANEWTVDVTTELDDDDEDDNDGGDEEDEDEDDDDDGGGAGKDKDDEQIMLILIL